MQYKAVIFDMDGTILDTLDDLADSVNHSLEKFGFPKRKREEIRTFLGNGMVQLIHLSVPEGTSSEKEAAVLEEHKKYYPLHSADKTKAYNGIPELLKDLKQKGIKTAVVSNKSDPNVKALVSRYFEGLFDVSVGSREGIPRKPAADLVNIALNELGVEKKETVYIGDSDVDLATAFNSGLEMITVLWGFRDREVLEKAGAGVFVNTADELKELLLKPVSNVKKNIILIGMPASGKSTVGVILAKILGKDFIDSDILIQKSKGFALSEIIESKGIDGFLKCEEQVLLSINALDTVIATGGSAVYSDAAMRHLSEEAVVIYLKIGQEDLKKRLKSIKERGVVMRPGESLEDMYAVRSKLYERYADIIVEEKGASVEDTVNAATEAIKNWRTYP